jgi:VWFA-related protein
MRYANIPFLVALFLASWANAQDPFGTNQAYRERVDVSRVLMDVRVVDDRGAPIGGLNAADFSVTIDGKAALVDSVEWVSGDSRPRTETQPGNVQTAPAKDNGRWIVFLYQKHSDLSDVEGIMRLRKDFAKFANLVTAGDHVAVVSFDTRLHLWLDFTNDIERVRRVIERDILVGSPPRLQVSPFPSLAASLPPKIANSTYTIEKSLRLLGEFLNPIPGAKSIVVLGYGMGTWLVRGGTVQMATDYGETVLSLLNARVSVFCIDVTKADYHPREEGLRIIADNTGGLYFNSHIFTATMFDRIAGALAGYYALLVLPPDDQRGERHVEITLLRKKGTAIGKHAYMAQ